jgi:prepilin signal peptidase PulO-like enzyme (type II secretory pathway)
VRDANGRYVLSAPSAVDAGAIRTLVGVGVLFISLAIFASQPHPAEDEQIVEALNAEAVSSRRNSLGELVLLLPAILMVGVAIVLLIEVDGFSSRINALLGLHVARHWQPLLGVATALVGWVAGGALAWATRVLGTLGLGKEALGMGDVHIMAAIGAIAGAMVAFLGFFIASILALLGVLVILFRRQSAALPYGPWLALGCFVVVLYQDKILAWFQVADLLR